MPTSYQTSATARGGRRREESDNQSSSKASPEGQQKLSKKVTKSSEGSAPSMNERPTSPASFVSSRSAPVERSALPKHPDFYSPSTMSLNSHRSVPHLDDDGPVTVPPMRQGSLIRPVSQLSTPPKRANDSSTPASTQTPRPAPLNEIVKPILPSPVSDILPKGRPQTQSSSTEGSRVLQPSVEEVSDGEMSTPGLAKPPSQEQASSAVLHLQHPPKDVVEAEDAKDVLNKVARKASRSPPPATPVVSPPISPRMHYQAAGPIDYGPNMSPTQPHYPYPYPPNMAMMPGSGPFYANQYYNTSFSPPVEQRQPYDVSGGGQSARSGGEDDHEHLLQKVSNVLPDIHRLLNEYKETHGQLSAKEMLVQQSEKEHEEKLSRLKIELDANKKEYEKVIQSLVGDRGKLEREATALRQQVADLQIVGEEHNKLKAQVVSLQNSHKELEATIETLRKTREEVLLSKEAQEKEFQHDREAHSRQVMEVQKRHEDGLAAKDKEHQQALSDQRSVLSKTQLDLASLISKHAGLKNDLEVSRNLQNSHKIQLDAKTRELDDVHARHTQEINTIKKAQEEHRGKSLSEIEAKNARIVDDHSRKEQKWMQELENLGNEMQRHKEDLEKEREEHQIVRAMRKREQDQASELARGIASWKAKHAELQTEHENVDRLLQSLRPVAEGKPKGDSFFIEAFQQLASSIAALSIDHFYNQPPTLPKDITRLIPSEVPDFMDQTNAARQLRAYYIQHKVFQVLTRRIFQPFLFILDCGCGGVDAFLQRLSLGIRSKSERREAAWRQITLRTAYRGTQAKKATHLVGHRTVEEILREIKWFTDEDGWPSLTLSVQFVVKAAVELWRYAKLERELVTASMPSATGLRGDEWLDIDHTSSQVGRDFERILVLCVTPHVARDAVHKEYLLPQERSEIMPLTFLPGQALYHDSEVVAKRRRELVEARIQCQ